MVIFGKKRAAAKLNKHALFHKIDFAHTLVMQSYNVDHPAKRKMVREFLDVYLSQVKILATEEAAKDKPEPKTFATRYAQALNNVYEYAQTVSGVPKIFIAKYKDIRHSNVQAIYNSLVEVASSNLYHSDMDKACAMFDILICDVLSCTVYSEKTLNTMNGDLERALKGSIHDQ